MVPRYNWNIVGSGVKYMYHKPQPSKQKLVACTYVLVCVLNNIYFMLKTSVVLY